MPVSPLGTSPNKQMPRHYGEDPKQMLDNGELQYDDPPKRQAGAMMVSLVERTCCTTSADGEVHEVGESDLDDDLEAADENENDLDESLEQNEESAEEDALDLDPAHSQAEHPETASDERP